MLTIGRKYYINKYIEKYLMYIISNGTIISTEEKREIFNIIKTGGPLTLIDFEKNYNGCKVYPVFIIGGKKAILFYEEKYFSLYKKVIQEEMEI